MLKKNDNYFIADDIKTDKITYGFFSKKGGCSTKNYYSLNCSVNSGDNKKLVEKNIQIAKTKLGLKNHELKLIKQNHSNKVEIISKKNLNEIINADGSITKNKKIALATITADCAPIFIFDLDYSFVCSLHAGWKGCLHNIVKNAVKKISKIQFKSQKLIAIIGPCLSKKNFEVTEKFKETFMNQDLKYEKFFSTKLNGYKYHFDMRGLINFQLQTCEIKKISNVIIDTYANKHLFYSHRRSSHNSEFPTGRLINMIGFKENT